MAMQRPGRNAVLGLLLVACTLLAASSGSSADGSAEAQEELLEAVTGNRAAKVKSLLRGNSIDVDEQYVLPGWSGRRTALMLAAVEGHISVINALIESGASASVLSDDGQTALMIASKYGDSAAVAALLAGGADVNLPNEDGVTALMEAAWQEHLETTALLIEHGADVDQQRRDEAFKGHTALMLAAQHGHTSAVELLIAAGANVQAQSGEVGSWVGWLPSWLPGNRKQMRALEYAQRARQLDIVALLHKAGQTSDL
jgi:ankyrin repeat protein